MWPKQKLKKNLVEIACQQKKKIASIPEAQFFGHPIRHY